MKAIRTAMIVAVLAFGLTSVANAEEWRIACDLNTPPQPEVFAALSDENRFKYAEECPDDIPQPPYGKAYAEDWTIIDSPDEYWKPAPEGYILDYGYIVPDGTWN